MGITIINNFNPNFGEPLDGRIVVDTMPDLATLVANGQAYEGMLVYVKDNGTGVPANYQYVNTATLPSIDLQWEVFSGSGSAGLHNTLPDLQGGQTGEYYHLNQRQWEYLTGLVPFIAPSLTITSSAGPTWAYQANVPSNIQISGTVVSNQGTNVYARLYDLSSGLPVTLSSPSGQDAQGYVPITGGSGVIIGTFPINGNSVPVDTSLVNGDTSQYRLDVKYQDLNSANKTSSKAITYTALKRFVDEVYYNSFGYSSNPVSNPPSLGSLTRTTKGGADSGVTVNLTIPTYGPGYVVFVISNDLTDGGNSSMVHISQNGFPVDNQFESLPYTGDTSASSDPSVGFLQFSSKTTIGNIQSYTIEIY